MQCELCQSSERIEQHHIIPRHYWRAWATGKLAQFLEAFTVPLCSPCHHAMHKAMGGYLWELTHSQQWIAQVCQIIREHKDAIILFALIAALIIHTLKTIDKEILRYEIAEWNTRYNSACSLLSEENG